jgi:hypothetical protein
MALSDPPPGRLRILRNRALTAYGTAAFAASAGLGCDTASGDEALATPLPLAAVQSAAPAKPLVPSAPARPRVDLSGNSEPLAVAVVDAGRPRVYAKSLRAWVLESPSRGAARLGYLRAGASSPTSEKPAGTEGCAGGWYPVEPAGFVCVGETATLDANDPVVRLTLEHPPVFSRRLPYIYGTVRNPGPVFAHLPTRDELESVEPDIAKRMPAWLAAEGEIGASYAQTVWLGGQGTPPDPNEAWSARRSDPAAELLRRGSPTRLADQESVLSREIVVEGMRPRVGYSFLHTMLFEGRRYGLANDLTLVPTDRLRPIQGSDFHGVEIGKDIELPFAFVRRPGARLFHFERAKNRLVDVGEAPYRATFALTGKQKFFKGRLHFETKDGRYLSDQDASRIDPAKKMPGWGKKGERWLDVNITKQTLVAYDGEKPVFATLVSTGEAGLGDHESSTATKRGIFRIHTKHVSSTMSSDEVGEEFELRDVPYVQYFEEGYALHGAYWHDRFGTPKSHGCINLAPEDARRLFFFTEPSVPTGWHGALKPLTGTVVFVHQ